MDQSVMNQEPTITTQQPTAKDEQLLTVPTAISVEPKEQPIAITEKLRSKSIPVTVTKNPARVIAGKRTAELMRQRKAEMSDLKISDVSSRLSEPWLSYVLGGALIVGALLFINKNMKTTTTTQNKSEPNIQVVQQTKSINAFNME